MIWVQRELPIQEIFNFLIVLSESTEINLNRSCIWISWIIISITFKTIIVLLGILCFTKWLTIILQDSLDESIQKLQIYWASVSLSPHTILFTNIWKKTNYIQSKRQENFLSADKNIIVLTSIFCSYFATYNKCGAIYEACLFLSMPCCW